MTWTDDGKVFVLNVTGDKKTIHFEATVNQKQLFTAEYAKNYRSGYARMNYPNWYEYKYGTTNSIEKGHFDSNFCIFGDGKVEISLESRYTSRNNHENTTAGKFEKNADLSGMSKIQYRVNQETIIAQSFSKRWTDSGSISNE